MSHTRKNLIPLTGISTSYEKKRKPGQYWDVEVFKACADVPEDFHQALVKLNELVAFNNGSLHIIDLYRTWEMQSEAREVYLKDKANTRKKNKKPFVAIPGGSFHNAARAVDIKLELLQFKGVPQADHLQFLWDIAKPLGFHPIIKIPDMHASESWHFDFPGKDWQEAYDTLSYSETAKCCTLDIGGWDPAEVEETTRKMFVQAQLIRLGFYEIGKVDGIFGPKTKKVLDFCCDTEFDTKTLADVLARRTR